MHTALVFDIDGVVCPSAGLDPGGLVEVGMALRPVLVRPEVCAAITALAARPGVVPVWLTSWLPETRRAMRPPFPGRDWAQLDLLPAAGWPKWQALTAWLPTQPQLTRVAWIDDDLSDDYLPRLRGLGLDALTIAPVPSHGITMAGLAAIGDWLAAR